MGDPLHVDDFMGGAREMPRAGDVIARKFRIERVLQHGGMGVVFLAQDLTLPRQVAVKFLLPEALASEGASERFLREASVGARLKSEHVARVYEVGALPDGTRYLAMEYLLGVDLAQHLHREGPLPVERAVDYVLQACDAIAEAHAAGIVHRDLKPSNLFLDQRPGGREVVKLLDFGIAKTPPALTGASWVVTASDRRMGSPLYMSPEQIRSSSRVDRRADVWALGVILHELVSRRYPFEGASATAVCAAIVADAPVPVRSHAPSVDPRVEEVILRCLEKSPDARFQDVSELAVALTPIAPPSAQPLIERIQRISDTPPAQLVSFPHVIPTTRRAPVAAPTRTHASSSLGGSLGASEERASAIALPVRRAPIVILGAGLLAAAVVGWVALRQARPPVREADANTAPEARAVAASSASSATGTGGDARPLHAIASADAADRAQAARPVDEAPTVERPPRSGRSAFSTAGGARASSGERRAAAAAPGPSSSSTAGAPPVPAPIPAPAALASSSPETVPTPVAPGLIETPY